MSRGEGPYVDAPVGSRVDSQALAQAYNSICRVRDELDENLIVHKDRTEKMVERLDNALGALEDAGI